MKIKSYLIALAQYNHDKWFLLCGNLDNNAMICFLFLVKIENLANAHANRVSKEGSCKWPKPKLVQVGNHTSKTYTPHCTVLHRCSDETGCCHTDYKTCQPRYKENVTLAFWVNTR